MNKIYKKIFFSDKSFDAIVCLDANLPNRFIFEKFENIPILAADGAAIKLHNLGIEPDYIIGDLDTFHQSNLVDKIPQEKIIYIPEQEHNDFEKVLMNAIEFNYKNVLIFGFHGGLLEHTLNNWSVFAKYSKKMNLCIFENGRYAIPLYCSFKMNVEIGEIISIIPMTRATLRTKNLKWNLFDEELAIGSREGARNLATKETIYIKIQSGAILLFFDARIPYAIDFE